MKFVVPVIVISLFVYFLYTGVKNVEHAKLASETSTPTKKHLEVTGGVQLAMAAIVLFVAICTFKKYGDLDYFFRVIHGCLNH